MARSLRSLYGRWRVRCAYFMVKGEIEKRRKGQKREVDKKEMDNGSNFS